MTAPTTAPFRVSDLVEANTPLVHVLLGSDGRPCGSHAGVIVHATAARVWAVVADVPSYSRRVPMIDRVTRAGDVVTMDLKFKIALFSVGFKARMDATVDEGKSILLAYKDGEPRDIEIRFDLERVESGDGGGEKTALFAYIGYDVLSLGWLTKWFLKHHPEIRFGIVPGSALALAQMLREAAEEKQAAMQQYLDLLRTILDTGKDRADRTGTGTRGIFGHQMRFDLAKGFPLVTTKKVHLKSIIHELLWFLRGDTHVAPLQAAGVRIWNEWATAEKTARFGRKEGDLGPVYGHQWKNFGATKNADGTYASDGVDQIARVVREIRENPNSRRLLVTGWNPKEADQVALPPCHTMFQLYVQDGALSCQLYQRSGDVFLGVPFNIASYALLTLMIAHITGTTPGEFVHTFGDAHLYSNHIEQARLQLAREPRPLPTMRIARPAREIQTMDAFVFEDFVLDGYDPHPHIAAPVSV